MRHEVGSFEKGNIVDDRNEWADYAKAIGVLLVVYGHVARGLHSAGISAQNGFYELADNIVYSFHMPLFFFLSGAFFYGSFVRRGGGGIILNKIDTIVYPYVVWSLLQGSLEAFFSTYTNGNVSYAEVLSLLWSPRAQFWFLYALFLVFVVSSAIFKFVPARASLIVFLLSVVLYLFSSALPKNVIYTLISQNLVFFLLGVIFSLNPRLKEVLGGIGLLFWACAFVLGQYLFNFVFPHHFFEKDVTSLSLAIISIAFVISASSLLAKMPNRLLAFIGSSSMAIYLMHILVGSGARIFLKKFLGITSFEIHVFVGVLVGASFPLLALLIIQKIRMPYVFSAPVSGWVARLYSGALRRLRHEAT